MKTKLLTLLISILCTACIADQSSPSAKATSSIKAPVADLPADEADPATPTTTTTLPPASFAAIAGTYRSGSQSLDILPDGSFQASVSQVYTVTRRSNGSQSEALYSCSITGALLSASVSGSVTTYSIRVDSSNYYKPTPNVATYAYASYGCLDSLTANQFYTEWTSATCLRVQNLGVISISSFSNTGLTFCK